jgi:hypothetical protein
MDLETYLELLQKVMPCITKCNSVSDGGVIENPKFYEKLLHEEIHLPLPRKPDNSTRDLPYVFVGDEAFALCKDLLKPFSQKHLTNERRVLIAICHEPEG